MTDKRRLKRLEEKAAGLRWWVAEHERRLERWHAMPVEPAGPLLRGAQIDCCRIDLMATQRSLAEVEQQIASLTGEVSA